MASRSETLTRLYELPYPNLPSIVALKKDRFPISQPIRGFVLTGDVCTGSTTLAHELAKGTDRTPFLVGEEIRALSKKLGVTWNEIPHDQLEKIYVDTQNRIMNGTDFIVEGRFVGEQAHGVDDVIKVLCTTHPTEVLRRYRERKKITSKRRGQSSLNARLNDDRASMISVYGGPTIGELFDRDMFDIVVDTTFVKPDQISQEIMSIISSSDFR